MNDRKLIADLLSALEYHVEQTRPIESSKVAIETAREHLAQPAPVQGWKLVPVEPIVAMVDATGAVEADLRDMVVADWKAMLAAAPQAPKENT